MKKLLLISFIFLFICSCKSNNTPEVTRGPTEISVSSNIILNTQTTSTTSTIPEASERPGDIPATESVDFYFDMLPDNVQKAFYEDNWTYEKVNYSLGEKYYNNEKQISGMTDFDNHIIYIDNRDDCNRSILHEVGHRFQYDSRVKGFESQEFLSLFQNHCSEWYINYGGHFNNYKTIKEAYAQCFEIYFIAPDCLDKETYDFISSEIKSI